LFSIDAEVAICSFAVLTDSQAGDEWTSRYVCRGGEFFGVDLTRMGISSGAIGRTNVGDDFMYSIHGANDASGRRVR